VYNIRLYLTHSQTSGVACLTLTCLSSQPHWTVSCLRSSLTRTTIRSHSAQRCGACFVLDIVSTFSAHEPDSLANTAEIAFIFQVLCLFCYCVWNQLVLWHSPQSTQAIYKVATIHKTLWWMHQNIVLSHGTNRVQVRHD